MKSIALINQIINPEMFLLHQTKQLEYLMMLVVIPINLKNLKVTLENKRYVSGMLNVFQH